MKKFQLSAMSFLLLLFQSSLAQQTTSVLQNGKEYPDHYSLSIVIASPADTTRKAVKNWKPFGLVDTMANDTFLKTFFKPYLSIKYTYFEHLFSKAKRSIPTIKEIKERPVNHEEWKFWIIVAILIYVSLVRIVNPNNFKVFILSVFNLKLSEKIWEDQRSFFWFVILQLFAIYLFIAALFISNWLYLKHIYFIENFMQQFLTISIILFLVYLGKFTLHAIFGYLLRMKNFGIGMVSNTISVNNFISLVILPLLIFLILNDNHLLKIVLSQTIIATFFLSVIYRVVRITLLSNSFFNFPKIYLFIYLCALEIVPWFVIIKYLNRFQI